MWNQKRTVCPERSMASLVVLGVYMMISNIILLNMLIALFSNTYDEIKGNSKIIWAGIRYETMIGGIHVLPFGPLNGIVQVFLIASVPHSIFYLFKCLFRASDPAAVQSRSAQNLFVSSGIFHSFATLSTQRFTTLIIGCFTRLIFLDIFKLNFILNVFLNQNFEESIPCRENKFYF